MIEVVLITLFVNSAIWFAVYCMTTEIKRRQWEYDDRPEHEKPDFSKKRFWYLVTWLLVNGFWLWFWFNLPNIWPAQR